MRALFLVTYTADCEKFWRSWNCFDDNTCHVEQYDNRNHSQHSQIVDLAGHYKPDVIVYLGAIEYYHKRPVLRPETLRALKAVAPSVHLCSDASDTPWWQWLEKYDKEECFSCQVSIDGHFKTPIANFKNGLVKLTPVDPTPYYQQRISWDRRTTFLGMAGGIGHTERLLTVTSLQHHAGLIQRYDMPFQEMVRFTSDCKLIFNHPMNGTGYGEHVKGRVLETGWAGACLLEKKNPTTSSWFPDDLYLQYVSPEDAVEKANWARANEGEIRDKAERFSRFIEDNHHPRIFWRDVLATAGVQNVDN